MFRSMLLVNIASTTSLRTFSSVSLFSYYFFAFMEQAGLDEVVFVRDVDQSLSYTTPSSALFPIAIF